MKDSVLTKDFEHCVICGCSQVQRHHVFYGTANRKLADEDGYWLPLCMEHHTGTDGVHNSRYLDLAMKQTAQKHYEETHTRKQFIQRYGKSYL